MRNPRMQWWSGVVSHAAALLPLVGSWQAVGTDAPTGWSTTPAADSVSRRLVWPPCGACHPPNPTTHITPSADRCAKSDGEHSEHCSGGWGPKDWRCSAVTKYTLRSRILNSKCSDCWPPEASNKRECRLPRTDDVTLSSESLVAIPLSWSALCSSGTPGTRETKLLRWLSRVPPDGHVTSAHRATVTVEYARSCLSSSVTLKRGRCVWPHDPVCNGVLVSQQVCRG